MDADVKAQWVEALRSGEYKQAIGCLHDVGTEDEPGGFCCLGVLTDLAVKAGVIPEPVLEQGADRWGYDNGFGGRESGVAPRPVAVWAELDDCNPDAGDDTLAQLNDSGASFTEIADVIEEFL